MTIEQAVPIRSTIPARDRLSWSPFHTRMVAGYLIGGAIMAAGGIIELAFGIKAEGKSLETVTKPLTARAS
jgi:hypothetical protein